MAEAGVTRNMKTLGKTSFSRVMEDLGHMRVALLALMLIVKEETRLSSRQ
jgi:hypothetical protein